MGSAVATEVDIEVLRQRETATKGFAELNDEIIRTGHCSQCMACIEVCREEGRNALAFEDETFRFEEDACSHCGVCYAVCPELATATRDLDELYRVNDSDIGRYLLVTSAMTRDRDIHRRSADGGVVTSILCYLLEAGLVDGALLSRPGGPWGREPFIARTRPEVLDAAGYRSGRQGTLTGLADVVASLQMMSFLRQIHRVAEDDVGRLAVVGLPCEIYALRKMQLTQVAPTPAVEYVLGLFCYENLSLAGWRLARFERITGVPVTEVTKVNMRESLVLTLRSGDVKHVDLDELSQVVATNCLRCVDFTSRYADISVGNLGSEEGFNTVVVRNERGFSGYQGALQAGYLIEWEDIFHRGNGAEPIAERVLPSVVAQTKKKEALASAKGRRFVPW
jgi:coenzyme F420 hydrogenase subunit beta